MPVCVANNHRAGQDELTGPVFCLRCGNINRLPSHHPNGSIVTEKTWFCW